MRRALGIACQRVGIRGRLRDAWTEAWKSGRNRKGVLLWYSFGLYRLLLRLRPSSGRPIQSLLRSTPARQSLLFCRKDTSVQASRQSYPGRLLGWLTYRQTDRQGGRQAGRATFQRQKSKRRRLRQRKVGTSICHLS